MVQSSPIAEWSGIQMASEYRTKFSLLTKWCSEYRTVIQRTIYSLNLQNGLANHHLILLLYLNRGPLQVGRQIVLTKTIESSMCLTYI